MSTRTFCLVMLALTIGTLGNIVIDAAARVIRPIEARP